MKYQIKNPQLLKKILWVDFSLGFVCGILGMLLSTVLHQLTDLPIPLFFWASVITLGYSFVAFPLAYVKNTPIGMLRILIYANWFWALLCAGFLAMHLKDLSILGIIYVLLQIIVIGGLAYFEGKQLEKVKA
jgi:hypothetical protein